MDDAYIKWLLPKTAFLLDITLAKMSSNSIIRIIDQHAVSALGTGIHSCHSVAEPSVSTIALATVYQ